MFCPNCSCELPAVAKFCVKCGSRVEVPPTASRPFGYFCMNCAKPLESSDKFCSYCGHKVIQPPSTHAQTASDVTATDVERFAERYSRMADEGLIHLSADLHQLTESAQRALMSEIEKRSLRRSPPIVQQVDLVPPPPKQSQVEESPDWDYLKMSDEELEQLCAAYQKLHQPINDALRSELDLRAHKRVQAVSTPSSSPIQTAPKIQVTATGQVLAGVTPPKSPPAPYARFVGQLLLACFCASVSVFVLFDALTRNRTVFAIEGVSVFLTLLFGWLGWTTWKGILKSEPRNELKSRRRVRAALVTSAVFILLYLGLAALLGAVIGQNRAEAVQFNFDATHQKELADRITKARSAVSNTIPSYLAMYAAIEPDVKDYASTLSRLMEDLRKYDDKFPTQHETTHRYAESMEKERRRSDLLTKQIAMAKQIGLLDETQQLAAWQSDMVPLLKDEDALDESK